jgi:hypothetical protein
MNGKQEDAMKRIVLMIITVFCVFTPLTAAAETGVGSLGIYD